MNKKTQVYFIGAGPGDPGLITVRGQELIRQADLVLYAGSLVPREVVACAREGALVVDSAPLSLDETHALMMRTVQAGGLVARVHTGEPALYGAVREQTALLDHDGIAHATIPGVTAAFAAAARAGVSFTVPEATQSLIITRLEGRTPVPDREKLRHLASHRSSMAVYLSADKSSELVRELRAADLPDNTVIVLGVKVGHPQEQILRTTLGELEATVRAHGIHRQAVFLILPAEEAPVVPSKLYDASFGHGFRPAERPATWPRLAVYAMTSQGLILAQRIATMHATDIFVPTRLATEDIHGFSRIADQVRTNFHAYHAHVFVAATGIVVRGIAPLLENKTADPAVLVCDQNGQHVISLLSGHLGGANALTRRLAEFLGAQAVITTATDTAGTPAIDTLAQDAGCVIANPERIKDVNALLAEGKAISVCDMENHLRLDAQSSSEHFRRTDDPDEAHVVVSWKTDVDKALLLHPACLVVGIGCRRGVAAEEIIAAVQDTFSANHLARASMKSLASVDLKENETGLLTAADYFGLPITFVERTTLAATAVPHPSETVREKIGVESVCEAAALHLARNTSLIVPKSIHGRVTVAVAQAVSAS